MQGHSQLERQSPIRELVRRPAARIVRVRPGVGDGELERSVVLDEPAECRASGDAPRCARSPTRLEDAEMLDAQLAEPSLGEEATHSALSLNLESIRIAAEIDEPALVEID